MMSHWMFNCREVTRMVSESLDRKLPLQQRIGIRMHLLMCRFCSRYRKQLLLLRETMSLYDLQRVDLGPPVSLPDEARERIKRSLRQG